MSLEVATQPICAPRRQAFSRAGYYLAILVPIFLYALIGHYRFAAHRPPEGEFSIGLLLLGQTVWIVPLTYAIITVVGLLRFGPPADRMPGSDWHWGADSTLIIAYVSRGQNQETLRRAASQTQSVLDALGVRYVLETVTDAPISPEYQLSATAGEVYYYVVPAEYQTSRKTRYKARALQYLLEQRTARLAGREDVENVWVLHLDEESIVTPESVHGISDFLALHDLRHTAGAIGQGEILYNSCRYGQAPMIEAIDAIRTGDDLGRFRVQFRAWHRPVFGMHGSFILTPARIERQITWDVGGDGAITEDAYFALIARERGVRFDWVSGFIREQSPFSLRDLVQQRRRWFCGLSHIARDPSLKFSTTFVLRMSLVFWQFSWLGCLASLLYYAKGFIEGTNSIPYWATLLVALCGGFFGAAYVVGAYRNVLHARIPASRKAFNVAFSFLAWLTLMPALVEGFSIIYALVKPVHHFHIVAKDLPA